MEMIDYYFIVCGCRAELEKLGEKGGQPQPMKS